MVTEGVEGGGAGLLSFVFLHAVVRYSMQSISKRFFIAQGL